MTVMSTTTWVNAASVSPTPVLCIIAQLYATLYAMEEGLTGKTKDRGNRVVGSK
jgi:hypothetical protein